MIVPCPVIIQARAIQFSAGVEERIALRHAGVSGLAIGIVRPTGHNPRAVGHGDGRA